MKSDDHIKRQMKEKIDNLRNNIRNFQEELNSDDFDDPFINELSNH